MAASAYQPVSVANGESVKAENVSATSENRRKKICENVEMKEKLKEKKSMKKMKKKIESGKQI
jgi:hypothetical protein